MKTKTHQSLTVTTLCLLIGVILFHIFTHWPYLEISEEINAYNVWEINIEKTWGSNDFFCDYRTDLDSDLGKVYPCYTKKVIRHWDNLLK